MKRVWYACIFILLTVAGALAVNSSESHAKRMLRKPMALEDNKVYRFDIDGDKKKEKIRTVTVGDDDKYTVKTTVYVNEKKYAVIREKGSYSHEVVLCDLFAGKKGMNLIVYGFSDSDCIGKMQVYQLGVKKAVKIGQMGSGRKGKLSYIRMLGNIIQAKEEGAFYIFPDTPFYLNYFGCYYTKVKCVIKNGRINWVEQKDYTYNYKYTFRLNANITMYEKPDTSSKSSELKKGTKLTVLKIRPIRRSESKGYYSFVKIKTANGRTGWIYDQPIEDYENYTSVFKSMPAWG